MGAETVRPALAWALLALVFSGAAVAAGKGPCAADAEKFCGDVKPGGGRTARCLAQHGQDLTPACRDQIAKAKQKIEEASEACKEDASRLCNGVRPGGGRIARCLSQHESELAPACKEEVSGGKQRVQHSSDSCREDAKKLCKGIHPGGGRIAECLKSHEPELSPGCKEKVKSGS